MTPPDLPEDVRKWPRDPYVLLCVDRAADRRAVRRAYTQLVRRYRPEQYPEEFRAIRDAYESVIASLDWREQSISYDDRDEDVSSEHPTEQIPIETVDRKSLSREHGFAAELEELWAQAQQGNPASAYARLVELHQQQAAPRDAVYLRLYWLLRVFPEVDNARLPIDWLTQGLQANRLTGPLRELYRRELERSPQFALGDECRGLLGLLAPADALVELAQWRWRVAGRLRKWDVLSADLKRLEQVVRRESEQAWGRLLLLAVEQMAWVAPPSRPPLAQWCLAQIEKLDHLNDALQWVYERLDFLEQVSAGYHKLQIASHIPSLLVDLVRDSWDGSDALIRQQAVAFVQPFVRRPRKLLVVFDQVKACGSGPLAQLNHIFQRAAMYAAVADVPPHKRDVLIPMIRDLVTNRPAYGYARSRILSFCVEYAIPPESIAWFASEWHIRLRDRTRLDDHLAADKVLPCAYQALRLFNQ